MSMATVEEVAKVLDEIRPSLQADGGDVELVGIEEDVVKVRLTGHCAGCAYSTMTLKMGIERLLKQRIPTIKGVQQV
ncbi:MAG: NifU family protein [Candidatus Helarchaeota archaeon]|nr:NifU family protein [Candidatus Helarchaeota archaeon]